MQLNESKLEILDTAISELYELIKDKDKGWGVIRLDDTGYPVAEFHNNLESAKKNDITRNLCMVNIKDNISRKIIRKACFVRLEVLENESKNP